MCHETITIALCAPEKSPHWGFTCGKLHLVAEHRTICDKAAGLCVCYYGTCGNPGRTVPANGIDFSAISKVRCISCTFREDSVGDPRKNQEILESTLLDPKAVHYVDVEQKFKMLKELWHHKSACPYHAEASLDDVSVQGPIESTTTDVFEHNEADSASAVDAVDSASAVDAWTGAPVSDKTDITEAAGFDSRFDKDHASIVGDGNDDVTTGADSAPVVDAWPGASVSSKTDITEAAGFDSSSNKDHASVVGNGNDDMTTGVINDGNASVKAGSDTDKGVQNGLEGGTTPVTRRAVNFSYSAETADKLRDATSKFASLKSGFLQGKAV